MLQNNVELMSRVLFPKKTSCYNQRQKLSTTITKKLTGFNFRNKIDMFKTLNPMVIALINIRVKSYEIFALENYR